MAKQFTRQAHVCQSSGKTQLFVLALADTMSPQRFNFEDILIFPGNQMEMTILEAYPGDKYADTATSEINLDVAH